MEKMTFTGACLKFFGRKPGQSAGEFAMELKALTPKDRAEMIEYFKAVNIDATKTSV